MNEPSSVNHAAFSERLRSELAKAGIPAKAGKLSREFNQRYVNYMVAPQTAGCWLNGRSIPGHARLRALAAWLGVAPSWPRHRHLLCSSVSAAILCPRFWQHLTPHGHKPLHSPSANTAAGSRIDAAS